MGFMNSMKSTLNEDFNESYTENGALGYRTTGRHLLDLNFKVASLRKADAETIISGFDKAFSEDHIHALKWLFYLRDAREGLGERRSFRIIMSHMANVEPEISKVLIGLIAEYGRYDDLLSLVGTECEKNALEVIKNQLMKDMEAKKANKPVSLLAKWMPSCNATSYKTKENATVVRKYLGFTERQYRKILSELREYIDVVERKMSAKKWGEINYEAVPSKANLVYNNAFLKNDEERRREYLDKLEKGETKINSSTNFPHDIVHSYLKGRSYYRSNIKEDKALEALWKALPDTVQGDGNTLVVRDGSGSMMCSVDPNSSITALEVATALEQLFKDRCAEYKKEYSLNFGVYYTPAENLCFTAMSKFRNKYGEIPNVSDKKFFTNSMHVPVWEEMSPFEKIDIEAELTGYSSAGCITYVELPSSVKQNIDALEEIVNYAMDKDIPYFAVNVPNDMCTECGYTDEIGDECPICGCRKIRRLRRVTGYLTGDYIEAFNEGKRQEVDYRVKHFNNALKAKTEKNESH